VHSHLSSRLHVAALKLKAQNRSLLSMGFTRAAFDVEPPVEYPAIDQANLCWGFHEPTISYGSATVSLREIVHGRNYANADFASEPTTTFVYTGSNGEVTVVDGCVRSSGCTRSGLDPTGRRLNPRTCALCAQIPKTNSVRMLVRRISNDRAAAAERGDRRSRINFRFMPQGEMLSTLRDLRRANKDQCWAIWQLKRKLVSARARARTLREKLVEKLERSDVSGMIADIISCERSGKWEERKVTFHFLRDMIHSLALTDEEGQRSRNMRWSETSKRIFATLKIIGGPKVNRFLRNTTEAPSDSTIARTMATTKLHMTVGIDEQTFRVVGETMARWCAQLGLTSGVLCELSEDETRVQDCVMLNARLDILCEFCGVNGPDHKCEESCRVVCGDRSVAFEKIERAFETQQRATYLRIIVVNPLHALMPDIVIAAHGTCNKFDAEFIATSWKTTAALWAKYLAPHLQLTGRGSDGDARRFSNQLREMSELPAGQSKYILDVEGFTLFGRWNGVDFATVTGIHMQDFRHNLAKLYSHGDRSTCTLHFFDFVASHQHVVRVVENAFARGGPELGVSRWMLDRKDLQVSCSTRMR
jgi:hypothetical protein